MSGGFLNDLGLDAVSADPNHIADGKYRAFVFNAEVRNKKNSEINSLVLTYKIAPEQKHAGQSQQEWFDLLPASATGDNAEFKRSYLKKRILSLGIPESKINEVNPGDLIGIEVAITIVHKNGYQNVGNLELVNDGVPVSAAPTVGGDTSTLL
jgi:hypothetical protein